MGRKLSAKKKPKLFRKPGLICGECEEYIRGSMIQHYYDRHAMTRRGQILKEQAREKERKNG